MRKHQDEITMLSAVTALGTGLAINVQDFKNVVFTLASANSGDFVIKFQGSISDTAPNFATAASATNHWIYIATIDYISGSVVAGGTGYTASGVDIFKLIQANISGLKYVCATITTYNAGDITLKVSLFSEH